MKEGQRRKPNSNEHCTVFNQMIAIILPPHLSAICTHTIKFLTNQGRCRRANSVNKWNNHEEKKLHTLIYTQTPYAEQSGIDIKRAQPCVIPQVGASPRLISHIGLRLKTLLGKPKLTGMPIRGSFLFNSVQSLPPTQTSLQWARLLFNILNLISTIYNNRCNNQYIVFLAPLHLTESLEGKPVLFT